VKIAVHGSPLHVHVPRTPAAGFTAAVHASGPLTVNQNPTLERLRREARPYYPRLAVAIVLGAATGVLMLVPPAAMNVIINRVVEPASRQQLPDLPALYWALGATYFALVLSNFATYGTNYIATWCGQRLLGGQRADLYNRLLRMPIQIFDRWRPGDLVARFNSDMQFMSDAVSVSLPQLITAVLTFASSLAFMVYLNWLITLVLLVLAPLVSVAVSRFQKLIQASTVRSQARISNLSATLVEVLQAQRIVKAFGREDFETERFNNRNDDYFGSFMKLSQFIYMQPAVISGIVAAAVVIIIWLSVREVLVGRLNAGSLFQYWALVVNLLNPINRFAAFTGDIGKGLVAATRVYEVLDLPIEEEPTASPQPMPAIRGKIAFEHVSFWYNQSESAALDDVHVHISDGEIVALVGPSGAGKTTFVNMIPRFYLPQQGCVRIDGIDISGVSVADLRRQIAIVPQDPQLFRASVAENIRYGRLDATDAEVRSAAMEANADEFVASLPDGYNTEVGERGVRLSGGQRQRIAIARAIVRDPRILILDEATSALDTHSEALIEQALDRLLPGRTTLIIAHRLSTIRRANRILYIDGGRLLEYGTHDELMARNGSYAKLHAAQFAI
jgi:subfamily B ATP-binding cassette protein MsbA